MTTTSNPENLTDRDAVLTRYLPFAHGVARRTLLFVEVKDRACSSEDYAQTGLLSAIRYFDRYDPARGQFRTWLANRVKSVISGAQRARRAKKRRPEVNAAGRVRRLRTVADPKGRNDYLADFWEYVFSLLSPREKCAILFRFCEGKDVRETADCMEVTESRVKTLTWQAMEKLRAAKLDILNALGRD